MPDRKHLPRASLQPLVLALAQPGVPRRPATTLHLSAFWVETGRLPFLPGLVTSSPFRAGLLCPVGQGVLCTTPRRQGCHAHRRRYRSVDSLRQFPKGESHESCSNKIGIIWPSSKGEDKVSQERSHLFLTLRSVRASGFLKITGLFIDPIFPESGDFPLSPSALASIHLYGHIIVAGTADIHLCLLRCAGPDTVASTLEEFTHVVIAAL